MAPNWPEEVDVFSVPHSRMKELVQSYLDQMTATNFSNVIHLTTLLENLCNTFKEFKIHEQIENKYILCKLRQKLRSLSIRNSAVCNCHSDNRLTEMLELVKDGFQWMWRPHADRVHYGFKLRRALEDFTGNFIPHMEEEESVFQPMLIEYFSYDELKAIKAEVIQQHLRKASENYQEEKFVEDTRSREVSDEEDDVISLNILPDEVLLNIFKYLTPVDLSRCSKVSTRWNLLSFDASLWTQIYPVHWSGGIWSMMKEEEESDLEMGIFDSYIVIDEDADIDETPASEISSGGDDNLRQVKTEVKILLSIVKYLLPKVGVHIKKCCLANSRGISNGIVKKILKLCPNLEHLNLRQTRITDAAFKVLGQSDCGRKLKHVDLSGCKNITDKALQKLADGFRFLEILERDGCVESANFVTNESLCDIEDSEKTKKLQNSEVKCDNVKQKAEKNIGICTNCGKVEIPDSVIIAETKLKNDVCPIDSTVSVLQDCLFQNYSKCGGDPTSGLVDLQNEFEQLVTLVKGDNSSTYQTDTVYTLAVAMSEEPILSKDEPKVNIKSAMYPQVEYLNLSGCQHITAEGIQYLVDLGCLPCLRYLDLSGCMNINGQAILDLVSISPTLDHTQLFYCDNLDDDPFIETASGCRNVDCSSRYCCRN